MKQLFTEQKIVSLLPAATEIVCLLGLQTNLVGVSDDSDYPLSVKNLPKITTTTLPPDLSSNEIDRRVKEAKHKGTSIFHIDRKLLQQLKPDLILTQELCPVCAPALTDIEKAASKVLLKTNIVSLEPHSISDILKNLRIVGKYTNTSDKTKEIIRSLKSRLSYVTNNVKGLKKPSVLVIEWLDPLMIAGHWVPEMVERAGGKMLFAKKAEASQYITWDEIVRLDPDVLILAPCGFTIERALQEQTLITKRQGFINLKAYKKKNIFLIDGNTYLTRPGPRIIDGVEIIAEIVHPALFPRKYAKNAWKKLSVSKLN